MDCGEAIDNFDYSGSAFADTVGSYVDNTADVSVGDVVDSGITYATDYVAMDTACDTGDGYSGSSGDSGE